MKRLRLFPRILVISVLACVGGDISPQLTNAGTSSPSASTQLDLTLHSSSVGLQSDADTATEVTLRRSGIVVASGSQHTSVGGKARVALVDGEGHPVLVAVDDAIEVRTGSAILVQFRVPNLRLDVIEQAGQPLLKGQTLPDHEVVVRTSPSIADQPRDETRFNTDVSGKFEFAPLVRLGPDERFRGEVELEVDGHRVRHAFAEFLAQVRVDGAVVRGQATTGSWVEVTVGKRRGGVYGPSRIAVDSNSVVPMLQDWQTQVRDNDRIRPGDRITVSHQAEYPPLNPDPLQWVVPELEIGFEPGSRRIYGRAPAGAQVSVEAGRGYFPSIREVVPADTDGNFELMADGVTLDSEWRARATLHVSRVLEFTAIEVHERFQLPVYGVQLRGFIAEPNQRIAMTLTNSLGQIKSSGWTLSDVEGSYVHQIGGSGDPRAAPTERFEPGDLLEIDVFGGDVQRHVVPRLSAETVLAEDAVQGEGPSNARLDFATQRFGQTITNTVRVDNAGQYRLSLGGPGQLASGDYGSVSYASSRGDVYYTGWIVPQLRIEWGSMTGAGAWLIASGPIVPGRTFQLRLVDAQGREVAAAHGRADSRGQRIGDVESFRTGPWLSNAGEAAEPFAGDVIHAHIGDQQFVLPVPPLEAWVDVPGQQIVGKSEPDARLQLTFGQAPDRLHQRAVQADAAGVFALSLAEPLRVEHTDRLWLDLSRADGHSFLRMIRAPGIELDLDERRAAGWSLPLARVDGQWVRQGKLLQVASADSATDGYFDFAFPSANTNASADPIEASDTIVVSSARGDEVLSMGIPVVPQLEFRIEPERGRVSGLAAGGTSLILEGLRAFDQSLNTVRTPIFPALGPGGEFDEATAAGDLPPGLVGPPGDGYRASYRTPDGHTIRRSRYVPILNAPVAGSELCGVSLPGIPLTATLRSAAGERLATARTQSASDSSFQMVLRDERGAVVVTEPGQDLELLGQGVGVIRVEVPDLSLDLTQDYQPQGQGVATLAVGKGMPRSRAVFSYSAEGCFSGSRFEDPSLGTSHQFAVTDGEGKVRTTLRRLQPGEAVEFAFFDRSGQRHYRLRREPQVRIYLGTPKIGARLSPHATATVILRDETDRILLELVLSADPWGDAEMRFPTPMERGILPGDQLEFATEQGQLMLQVPRLDFDFDPDTGLFVNAAEREPVHIDMGLATGRELHFDGIPDIDGAFLIRPEDLSPRRSWELADVQWIRLEQEIAGGHLLVLEAQRDQRPRFQIFLPFSLRGR